MPKKENVLALYEKALIEQKVATKVIIFIINI